MKTWFKRFFFVITFIFMLVLLVGFSVSNNEEVLLNLLGWSTWTFKVSTIVVVPFIIGGMVSLVVAILSTTQLCLKNASLLRKINRRDAELQKLRSNSLKGLKDA